MNTNVKVSTPWCSSLKTPTPPPGMSTQEPTPRPRKHGHGLSGEPSERRLVGRWRMVGSELEFAGMVPAPLLDRLTGTLPPLAALPDPNTPDAAHEPGGAREPVGSLGGAHP